MKTRFCTILIVALLVVPAASLGVAQEATPPPEDWGAPPEQRGVEPPEPRNLEGWVPPPPSTGPGAVITVTTTDDELNADGDCSLREAIEAANTDAAVDACTAGSGADTVLVPAGTYLLTIAGVGEDLNQTGDLDILGHLTLTGDGANSTILDGNNLDRVLDMWTNHTVEINALTITHGRIVDAPNVHGHGAGICNQGTLTLNDVFLLDNAVVTSGGYGGGGLANVAWSYDSSATLNNCLVDGNEAGIAGGLLSASGTGRTSELTLNDSTVSNNKADPLFAGGLYVGTFSGSQNTVSNMVVLNSTVEGNMATLEAGGIEAVGRAASNMVTSLTVDHSTVADNTSTSSNGGGIGAYNTAGSTPAVSVTVTHSTIEGNTAVTAGGGISALSTGASNPAITLTVDHCTIRNNTASTTVAEAGLGGGIFTWDAAVTIVGSAIHDNTASCENLSYCGAGGGLFLRESPLTVEATTIYNNTASGTGTGTAIGQGGGLIFLNDEATVRNSTVSGNQASHDGGGIHVNGWTMATALTLENTTVTGNSAGLAGGGLTNRNGGPGATTSFKNSLFGGNSAPADEGCYNPDLGFGPGILDSLGNNLEDHDTCEFDQPTDLPNTDPILGPLQDNGGPTWTHALLAGSPAIDAGDDDAAPPTDQRGVPRPQGPASDIGSYEANILVNTCDDELNSDGDCSLREAIQAANTDAAVDACLAGSGHDYLTLPACTYTLAIPGADEDNNQTGDLDILDDLTIYGAGADTTVIDANQLDRIVQVHPGHTAEINDLTVTGGLVVDDDGSAIENLGTLTLNDAIVRGNTLQTSGFSWGGALANSAVVQDATTYVNHSLIAENIAPCCAGLQNATMAGLTAELHVDHTSVVSNTATMFGGGVYNGWLEATGGEAILTLTDSLVAANSALGYGYGGGIFATGYEATGIYAWMTMERVTVRDNTAINDPGGYGAQGAGVAIYETTTTVLDSTISGNIGTGVGDLQPALGGGMYIYASAVTVTNTTISGNQVLGEAGGSGAGGGIALVTSDAPANLSLLNVTLADNSADVEGGAIAIGKTGPVTPTVTFKNTLIAGNTAPEGPSCFRADLGYGLGEFISLGNNLEDYDLCQFDQPTDLPDTVGLLGPLQDNGGPTWTHALLEGSLARDHGDDAACPPADQRGVPRPQGPHCDISAFEADPDTVPPAVVAVRPPDGAVDVAIDAALVITFSEAISVPTFIYGVAPDPGGWTESWGSNDMVVSLTHDALAYGTVYSASVTAAEDWGGNPLAAPYTWSFSTVAAPCEPVEEVAVEGPASLLVGETGVYSATYAPLTATLPVTLTWDNGTVGSTASYTWTLPGSYTLTVTATNPCGEAVGKFPVEVSAEGMHRIYLPVVFRDSG